jgi:hypothetical protein
LGSVMRNDADRRNADLIIDALVFAVDRLGLLGGSWFARHGARACVRQF